MASERKWPEFHTRFIGGLYSMICQYMHQFIAKIICYNVREVIESVEIGFTNKTSQRGCGVNIIIVHFSSIFKSLLCLILSFRCNLWYYALMPRLMFDLEHIGSNLPYLNLLFFITPTFVNLCIHYTIC